MDRLALMSPSHLPDDTNYPAAPARGYPVEIRPCGFGCAPAARVVAVKEAWQTLAAQALDLSPLLLRKRKLLPRCLLAKPGQRGAVADTRCAATACCGQSRL